MGIEIAPVELSFYQTAQGVCPFEEWMDSLPDVKTHQVIVARLGRLRRGLFGDVRSVGNGVDELRVHFGPGYRIYFARRGSAVVLLLLGGDKSSQEEDIRKAKDYWADYLRRSIA